MKRGFLALLILFPLWARAQEVAPLHLVGDVTEGAYDFTSHQWNWQGIGILGAAGIGSYLMYKWVDPEIDHSAHSPSLGRTSRALTDIGTYAPFIVPVGLFTAGLMFPKGDVHRRQLWMTTEQMVETLLLAGGTAFVLKYAVHRNRPNQADHRSFPSLHAAAAFATAGVLAYQCPWYVGVPSLMVASAIGFSRVDLRDHFPSDVLAGAGIGLVVASAVHFYHRRFEQSGVSVTPIVTKDMYGLNIAVTR